MSSCKVNSCSNDKRQCTGRFLLRGWQYGLLACAVCRCPGGIVCSCA